MLVFLRVLNVVLLLAVLAFGGLFAKRIVEQRESQGENTSVQIKAPQVNVEENVDDSFETSIAPYASYSTEFTTRNVFQAPWEKAKKETGVQKAAAPELSTVIRVLGIVLDDNPSVIVEDIKAQNTDFLTQGQEIQGAIIEEIQPDKVIFMYNGKKVELSP